MTNQLETVKCSICTKQVPKNEIAKENKYENKIVYFCKTCDKQLQNILKILPKGGLQGILGKRK